MDQQPPEQGSKKRSWLVSKEYADEAEKKKDLWRGFWLWWGLNILLWVVSTALAVGASNFTYSDNELVSSIASVAGLLVGLLPWLINIGFIIFFAFTRSQMALGMLLAFGVALAIVIVLGIVFAVVCFVLIAAGNS